MNLTLVYLNDWAIVYKDGEKVWEDHSIDEEHLLRLAGVQFESRYLDGTDFDIQVCETGQTPDFLSEVPS